VPFRPRTRRSFPSTLIALLLLSGDIESNPGPQPPNDYISLGSFNIRSVKSKAALLHDLILDNNIDILALQETWLPPDSHPAIKLDIAPPGFVVSHVHRPIVAGGPTRGGGLAIIHRDFYKARQIDLHFRPTTFEMQPLLIYTSTPPILIINIYQPHSPPTSAFYDELSSLLSDVAVESTARLVLCGDVHCPGDDDQSVNSSLIDVLVSSGLQQHVHQPTRGANLLDIVATSDPGVVRGIEVIDCCVTSDHRLVVAKIQSRRPSPPTIQFTFRDLKRLNYSEFEASLRRSSLFTDPAKTADAFTAQLRTIVSEQLDLFAPLKTVRKRAQKPSAKWLSADAVAAKRLQRRLERAWHSSHSETDRAAYRAACRRANALINSSRSEFMRHELETCADSRQRWTAVKRLLHSDDNKQIPISVDVGLCEKFSDYFISKIANLRLNICSRLSSLPPQSLPSEPTYSGPLLQTLLPVSPHEVANILTKIPPKTSDLDFIPTSVLKTCCSVFSELIAKLANLSFQEGCFPQNFKSALVTPLLKKPNLDPENLSNFRPISNLNNISKILERLFLTRLRPRVLASPNFNPFQSAYRRNHSTETALLCTLDNVFHSADLGKSTVLVSLDLSSAFDTIDHSLLLNRLKTTFGISGPALNWITSYLSNRSQSVKFGKLMSCPQTCTSGVPQGSVLGPLFFTIYVSPIASLLSQSGVNQHQYADDTQLHIAISPTTSSSELCKLESALHTLSYWFSQNWLALNPEKSDAILLGTHQRNNTLANISTINVAGSAVSLSDHIKLLGITLDNTLTFHKHINFVSQSCFYHIKALRHIRHTLDTHTASLIAHALVSSRLDYANSVLYGAPSYTVTKLQRIQNTLARIVLHSNRFSHSNTLLHQLHWLPVHSRIRFKLATITYNSLSTSSPDYLATLISRYQPARSLRSADLQLLNLPASKTKFGSRAFRCAAPSIWNAIPLTVRNSQSITSFKNHLKTFYFCHPPA